MDDAGLIHHKSHDAGIAVPGRVGDEWEAACEFAAVQCQRRKKQSAREENRKEPLVRVHRQPPTDPRLCEALVDAPKKIFTRAAGNARAQECCINLAASPNVSRIVRPRTKRAPR